MLPFPPHQTTHTVPLGQLQVTAPPAPPLLAPAAPPLLAPAAPPVLAPPELLPPSSLSPLQPPHKVKHTNRERMWRIQSG